MMVLHFHLNRGLEKLNLLVLDLLPFEKLQARQGDTIIRSNHIGLRYVARHFSGRS